MDVNGEVKFFFVKIQKKNGGGWVGVGEGPIGVGGRWVIWGMGDVNQE